MMNDAMTSVSAADPAGKTASFEAPLTDGLGIVGRLLDQIYQMQGMFPGDEALEEAIEEAEEFLKGTHKVYVCIDEKFCGDVSVFHEAAKAEAWESERNKRWEGDDDEPVDPHLKTYVF